VSSLNFRQDSQKILNKSLLAFSTWDYDDPLDFRVQPSILVTVPGKINGFGLTERGKAQVTSIQKSWFTTVYQSFPVTYKPLKSERERAAGSIPEPYLVQASSPRDFAHPAPPTPRLTGPKSAPIWR